MVEITNITNTEFQLEIWKNKNTSLSENEDFVFLGQSNTYRLKNISSLNVKKYNEGIVIILYGEIYNQKEYSLDLICQLYKSSDVDNIIKKVEGSYALFILDLKTDSLFCYTDKIGSRKIFLFQKENYICLSNSIYSFKNQQLTINEASLGFYFSNGCTLSNNTLFNEVQVLEYAIKLIVTNENISSIKYWDFIFKNNDTTKKISDLISKFSELLNLSIQKRINKQKKSIIALSGGYDSSIILGELINNRNTASIKAFNYTYGTPFYLSDSFIAEKIASNNKIEIESFPIYNTSVINNLQLNAYLTQGVARPCEEIDALTTLYQKSEPNFEIFLGDECFGINDEVLFSEEDALKSHRIYRFHNLLFMKRYFQKSVYEKLESKASVIFKDLLLSLPKFDSYFDLKHYLYFKIRVTGILAMWRDFFYKRFANAYNPLLDYNILEFVLKLKPSLRKNRYFLKVAAKSIFPNIFNIPRAKFSNAPNKKQLYSQLQIELLDNKDLFEKNILDEYIDTNRLFNDFIKSKNKYNLNLFVIQKYARKIVKRYTLLTKVFKNTKLINYEYIDIFEFIKRTIVLKKFFKNMNF